MIEIQGLSFRFPGSPVGLFDKFDLTLASSEKAALVGASGAGKTTLIQVLSGLLPCREGKIWCAGTKLPLGDDDAMSDFRNRRLGIIFQNYNLLPRLTVEENLRLRMAIAKRAMDREQQREWLDRVGLADFFRARVATLSGGQQQRVAAVRAMMTEPEIVLADEPTGNLDDVSAHMVVQLLISASPTSTVLAATHDPRVLAHFPRRIALDGSEGES